MPDKKINELPAASSVDTTDLIAVADPTSGLAEKATVNLLPFIPKGGTTNYIPKTVAGGGQTDSAISSSSSSVVINTIPLVIDTPSKVTGLYLSLGTTNTGGEQHAISINSAAAYSDIDLTAAIIAAIRLRAGTSALQIYCASSGEGVLRNSNGPLKLVPQGTDNRFIVGGSTNVNSSNWFTVFPSGNARLDGGTTDPGVKLYMAGYIVETGVLEYADNAAAVTAGLPVGAHYRTGDLLKIVHA